MSCDSSSIRRSSFELGPVGSTIMASALAPDSTLEDHGKKLLFRSRVNGLNRVRPQWTFPLSKHLVLICPACMEFEREFQTQQHLLSDVRAGCLTGDPWTLYDSFAGLKASAAAGCDLCRFIHYYLIYRCFSRREISQIQEANRAILVRPFWKSREGKTTMFSELFCDSIQAPIAIDPWLANSTSPGYSTGSQEPVQRSRTCR